MKKNSDTCFFTKKTTNIIHKIKYFSSSMLLLVLTTHVSNAQDFPRNQTLSNYLEVFNILPLTGNIKSVKKEKIVDGDIYITELFFNKAHCLIRVREVEENKLTESNPTGSIFYKIVDNKKLIHVTQNKDCQITSYIDYYIGDTFETHYTYKEGRISELKNKTITTTYFYTPDNLVSRYIVRDNPSIRNIRNSTLTFIHQYNKNRNFEKVIIIRENIRKDGKKRVSYGEINCAVPDRNGNPTKCIATDGTMINMTIDYYD